MLLWKNPFVMELSVLIGVGGWGWPNASRAQRRTLDCLLCIVEDTPVSASAAEAATDLSV